MQRSTQSVNKIDGFFLARNANARRHLTWESELKTQSRRASYSKGLIYLKAIFRQYIGETKRTQSMRVLKNAGIEDSTLLRHTC